jgi:hypothetical protein
MDEMAFEWKYLTFYLVLGRAVEVQLQKLKILAPGFYPATRFCIDLHCVAIIHYLIAVTLVVELQFSQFSRDHLADIYRGLIESIATSRKIRRQLAPIFRAGFAGVTPVPVFVSDYCAARHQQRTYY